MMTNFLEQALPAFASGWLCTGKKQLHRSVSACIGIELEIGLPQLLATVTFQRVYRSMHVR